MGRPGKGMNTSLDLRTKRSNKKQKSTFTITEITNYDFRKMLNKFKSLTYLRYKSKPVHGEPTETRLLIIKNITKLMKIERHIQIRTNFVKSGVKTNWTHKRGKIYMSTKNTI